MSYVVVRANHGSRGAMELLQGVGSGLFPRSPYCLDPPGCLTARLAHALGGGRERKGWYESES